MGIGGLLAVGGAELVDDPRQRTAVADGVVQGDGEDLLLALLVAYEEEPQGGTLGIPGFQSATERVGGRLSRYEGRPGHADVRIGDAQDGSASDDGGP
ncbi:hypothetical protein [Streptomyces sp. NBC_01294]|uniref:hypothetical protein n=1 Tax=Streptomyces sp. NBC_01294 TaxID=2903815 RepID=UPI002DD995B5|nr:hypothetical protein [Streptomyces sp. NBC_01294]WRZ61461.1 hypothetical protein OG534_36205 [Streptomyces sp. NBC_01294]